MSDQNTRPRRGFWRLVELMLGYGRQTLLGMVGVVVTDLVTLSVPWLTMTIIDRLEANLMTPRELIQWAMLLLLLAVVSFLAKKLWRHLILGSGRRIEANLRRELLEKTLTLTPQRASQTQAGQFMALATNDIPAVGEALAFGLIAFFDSIFITVVAGSLMFTLSPTLTAWTLLPFPALGLLMAICMRLVYGRWDDVQGSLEKLTEKTRESLSGMRTLRAYVQAEGDTEAFQEKNNEFLRMMMRYVRVDASFSPVILLFAGSSSAILLGVGGPMVLDGDLSVGSLAAFIGYLSLLTWPMIAAGWMLVLLQRGSASMARLDAILSDPGESVETFRQAAEIGTLEVRNLDFSYPNGPPVLKDWSLRCEPGQFLGIVGPVGCGKTTFFQLLMGLETIPRGCLFFNGEDLASFELSRRRRLFSIVTQEPFLFSDTVANNLKLAFPTATETELKNAIEVADLSADLALFPNGMETELGERGISLSGGQRQRAALARAWLKAAPILLLDDTLSAVDTLTEQRILTHLQRARTESRALIVISHRLSALRNADEILVIREGHIVERGRHEFLAQKPGLYRELLAIQDNDGDGFV